MALKTLEVKIVASVGQFQAQMGAAAAATRQFGTDLNTASKNHAQALATMSRVATGIGVVMVAGFGVAVAAAARFDKALSGVQAVSNSTAAEMGKLRQAALDAGKATVFSASEAAAAEAELVKAGISVNDVLAGALTGSLDLAAAGQLGLADAATIAAQAMNIFKLNGGDVSHIADVIAAGANKSAADVGQLGDALRQGGLVASQYGLSLEDTVGTLSAFADNALIGSDAGTSLKTMLQRLSPISKESADLMEKLGFSAYDLQGNFIGIQGVADELQTSMAGMSQKVRDTTLATLFGSDAVRGANVLYEEGAKGIADYTAAVNDEGAAARMAAIQMDNLAGDLERLKGSIETALIQTGSGANDVLRTIAQGAESAVNAFAGLPIGLQQGAAGFVAVTGAGLATLGVIGTMIPKIRVARDAIAGMGVAGRLASSGIGLIGTASLIALPAILILGKAWTDASAHADAAVESFTQKVETNNITSIESAMEAVAGRVSELDAEFEEAGSRWGDFQRIVKGAFEVATPFTANTIADNAVETRKLQQAYESLGEGAEQVRWNLETMRGEMGLSAAETVKLADAIGVDLRDSSFDVIPLLKEAVANIAAGTPLTEEFAQAQATLASDVESAADQLDAFNDVLDIVLNQAFGGTDALADIAAGFDDIYEAVLANGTSLDINTAAGRENVGLLQDQTEAAINHIRWLKEQDVSTADLTTALALQKQQLHDTLIQMGYSEEQVATYTGVLQTASDVTIETPVKVTGLEKAKADLASLGMAVVELRGRVQAANGAFGKAAAGQFLDQPSARGLARGGITRYAMGGYNPGIYSDGADVVRFAERGTGGESYIPLANDGRRARALDIWAETGRILGAFARGAIVDWSDEITIKLPTNAPGMAGPGATGGMGGYNGADAPGGIVALGRALQAMGIRVSEHPAFGGVTAGAHVKNSKHYSGRAIDLNYGAGTSAREQAKFDSIEGWVRRQPGVRQVLWRVPNHFNHMHVGFNQGGIAGRGGARKPGDVRLADGRRFVSYATGGLRPGDPGYVYQPPPPGVSATTGVARSVDQAIRGAAADAERAANDAERAAAEAWAATQVRYQVGSLSEADYAATLRKRLATLSKFSDEWKQAYDELAQLEEKDVTRRRAYNDLLYQMGELTYEEQLGNLKRRVDAEETYSLEWLQALKAQDDFMEEHRQRLVELHNLDFEEGRLSLEQHIGNLDRRIKAEREGSIEQRRLQQERYDLLVEIHNNEFELGRLTTQQQVENLERRMAKEVEFSSAWLALYRQREQVLEEAGRVEREAAERLVAGLTDVYESATAAFTRQQDDYTDALKRRNEAIETEVLRFRDSIREPLQGTADLLSNFGGRSEAVRGDDIVAMLEHRTEAADRFGEALETLRERGLDNDLLNRLAQGGPENVNLAEALAGGDVATVNRLLAGLVDRGDDLADMFVDANRSQIEATVAQENALPVMQSMNDLLAEELQRQTEAQVARNEAKAWAEGMANGTLPGLTAQVQAYTAALAAANVEQAKAPYASGSLPSARGAAAPPPSAPQPLGIDQQLLAGRDEVGIRNRINDIYTNRNVAVDGHELNRITQQVMAAIVTLDQVRNFVDHLPKKSFDVPGYLSPGWTLAYNGTGRNEPVGGSNTVNFAPVISIDARGSAAGVGAEIDRVVDARMGKAFGDLKTLIGHGVR